MSPTKRPQVLIEKTQNRLTFMTLQSDSTTEAGMVDLLLDSEAESELLLDVLFWTQKILDRIRRVSCGSL
jgi:hypothetical protein